MSLHGFRHNKEHNLSDKGALVNMDDEWQSAGSENAANAELVSSAPVDPSVDSEESRIIFQTKRVNLAIAVLPNAFDDARFHIGGMDDPRIITPLGSEIVLNVYNQDGLRSHGWKLIRRTPPSPVPRKPHRTRQPFRVPKSRTFPPMNKERRISLSINRVCTLISVRN